MEICLLKKAETLFGTCFEKKFQSHIFPRIMHKIWPVCKGLTAGRVDLSESGKIRKHKNLIKISAETIRLIMINRQLI